MLPLQKIREDLKEIRYYYSKQKLFDSVAKTVVQSAVLEKVEMYNQAIKDAPIRLYELYISLYVMNNTQETLAYDWDCSITYVAQESKKLCQYLQQKLPQS